MLTSEEIMLISNKKMTGEKYPTSLTILTTISHINHLDKHLDSSDNHHDQPVDNCDHPNPPDDHDDRHHDLNYRPNDHPDYTYTLTTQ